MALDLLRLRGKEYILIPRKQYERLAEAEQDRRDAAKAAKAMAAFRAGKSKAIPLSELKRKLGMA